MTRYNLLKEFLNEADEVHSLWFGFYSSFRSLRRLRLSAEQKENIKNEYHYYTLGFFVGRMIQMGLFGVCGLKII